MQTSSGKQVGTFIVVGTMWVAAACGGVGVGDPGAGGEGGWGVGGDAGDEYTDAGDDGGRRDTSGDSTDRTDDDAEEVREVGTDGKETETPPERDVADDDLGEVEEHTTEAVQAYNWGRTGPGSHGTMVEWHQFAPDGRLDYTEEWRRTRSHVEPEATSAKGDYEVDANGAVDWTLPRHASQSDATASERRLETFVSVRPSYDFVELSPEDDVVEGIERVWIRGGLRAQNGARTRFAGVTGSYRDNYDEDEAWNSIRRVERVVEFERTPEVGMDDCEFDLRMAVVEKPAQDREARRASRTFEDLSCSVPNEDGPVYDIVVDRFADTDTNLRYEWEQFLEKRGLDKYENDVFRAFSRGFEPVFHYDVTRRDVLMMGNTNESLMVGTSVDGPPEAEEEGS